MISDQVPKEISDRIKNRVRQIDLSKVQEWSDEHDGRFFDMLYLPKPLDAILIFEKEYKDVPFLENKPPVISEQGK